MPEVGVDGVGDGVHVVEEDALDQWPAGPLASVGQPATRIDGRARAEGRAGYTADICLPGMLHAAVLRSPHAKARVARLEAMRAEIDGRLANPLLYARGDSEAVAELQRKRAEVEEGLARAETLWLAALERLEGVG